MKLEIKYWLTHAFIFILATVCIYLLFMNINMPGDWVTKEATGMTESTTHWGFLSYLYILSWIGGSIWYIANTINTYEEYDTNDEELEKNTPNLNLFKMKWKNKIIAVIVLCLLWSLGGKITDKSKVIYNTSVVYNKQYAQKTSELAGFYDKMWKTYFAKDKVALMNKDVFIEVARLQTESRKDGSAVAWKWVHENTNIPYHEFTAFYKDLSNYIESQREAYNNLENQRIAIATAHNMLIDTFPNNVYNMVIGRNHIKFEYAMLSDSTNKVFSTKVENIK